VCHSWGEHAVGSQQHVANFGKVGGDAAGFGPAGRQRVQVRGLEFRQDGGGASAAGVGDAPLGAAPAADGGIRKDEEAGFARVGSGYFCRK